MKNGVFRSLQLVRVFSHAYTEVGRKYIDMHEAVRRNTGLLSLHTPCWLPNNILLRSISKESRCFSWNV